ncbi:MAG: hypothetical protein F7C07_06100 [Desulfurococcales archaeon]|nr:hypothetical protein [Desulfurococcales archaeon]
MSDPRKDPAVVKRMAQLVSQGASMLAETCPMDGLPLFKLRSGDIICPVHGKVLIVSSEEEAREAEVDSILSTVAYYAAVRIREAMNSGDPGEMLEWLNVLEAAERVREIRGSRKGGMPLATGRETTRSKK